MLTGHLLRMKGKGKPVPKDRRYAADAADPRKPRAPRPLTAQKLRDMALRYVARYATSSHKLRQYLQRKLKERGWDSDAPADIDALVVYCVAQGFVDDALYADTKAASLTRRGYGARRIADTLHMAGIGDKDAQGARDHGDAMRWAAALTLAKRRKIGPFRASDARADDDTSLQDSGLQDNSRQNDEQAYQQREQNQKNRQKHIQMMVRSGHDFAVAATLVDARNLEQLRAIGDEQLDIALDALAMPE